MDKIDFLDGDVVVDCGANMGDLQLYFLANGLVVRYFGFEPNSKDFYCASRNLIFDGNEFEEALWSSNEKLTFFQDT